MEKVSPDSLAGLHDVVSPPVVSYTPQTLGWVVLAAGLVVLLASLGWRAWKRARANRYRKVALAEIDRIEAALRDPAARPSVLAGVNEILKRTALTAWPRPEVAFLAGDAWLEFLDATAEGEDFRRGPGRVLADRVYAPGAPGGESVDVSAVLGAVRHWIRRHRVAADVPAGAPPAAAGERDAAVEARP